jgi:glycosyltransferase involved in cell wall biosynthesis
MDTVVTNSENVRRRIHRYLHKEAHVVHPPCDIARFVWQGQGDYYLSTARLDPLKRVESIIRAFLKMPDKRLIVVSGGAQLPYLQRLAQQASHIHFTGWVSDAQLATLLGNAIATLYLPKDEDFGMSPVESMAAGKPVIGVAEGGLLETIIPGETGLLVATPLNVESICEAVNTVTPQRALSMRRACEKRAYHFRSEVFLEKMKDLLKLGK